MCPDRGVDRHLHAHPHRRGLLRCLALGLLAAQGLLGTRVAHAAAPLLLARRAPADVDPAGHLVSEKLDGVRAYWDGARLWSRSELPLAAPPGFIAHLPPGVALDGELWLGRGRFEALSATVRRQAPSDDAWRDVRYQLHELPGAPGRFDERVARLHALVDARGGLPLAVTAQHVLPDRAALQALLDEVVRGGGEGLMLHRADAPYVSGRSDWLLKLKPVHDAEAVVIGHTPGRGKYEGLTGALRVCDALGRVFLVGSGLTDAQRLQPPPVGAVITYRYRGETASGLPRFATLLRVREAP